MDSGGLEHHRSRLARQEGLLLAHYFSDWRSRSYSCNCGWTGSHEALDDELFDTVNEKSCPNWGTRLLIVSLPTADDIRRAAEAGNEEAKGMLAQVIETERRAAEWARSALRSPSQLPDIDGEAPIAFVWERISRSSSSQSSSAFTRGTSST